MLDLLNGTMSPITSEFGFVEAEPREVVKTFSNWQSQLGDHWKLDVCKEGSLADALAALLPLTNGMSLRELFLLTESPWTAYFCNLVPTADASSRMAVLARFMGRRALRVVNVANTISKGDGRYGATILEIFGPEKEGQPLNYIRSISAANDGGRWVFDQWGEQQGFEEPEHYTKRLVKDRFTSEMLDRYLRALGIRAFDSNFYKPADGLLLTRMNPPNAKITSFSLEEARAKYGA